MNKAKEETLADSDNINLFTAMSVFIGNAPRCIDKIVDAAEMQDMQRVEELAAKLSVCSDMARLAGFVDRTRSIILAAREQKPNDVKKLAAGLKQAFEQIVNFTGQMKIEDSEEFKNFSEIHYQA